MSHVQPDGIELLYGLPECQVPQLGEGYLFRVERVGRELNDPAIFDPGTGKGKLFHDGPRTVGRTVNGVNDQHLQILHGGHGIGQVLVLRLEDEEESRRIIDEMLSLKTTDEQRLVLLLRAFNFFVEQEDYARAKETLEELRERAEGEQLAECEQTYAIFAEKSSAYIKEMEAKLRTAKATERATLLYLLSVQYENRGDQRRANEYLEQVQSEFSEIPGMPVAAGSETES